MSSAEAALITIGIFAVIGLVAFLGLRALDKARNPSVTPTKAGDLVPAVEVNVAKQALPRALGGITAGILGYFSHLMTVETAFVIAAMGVGWAIIPALRKKPRGAA